MIKKIDKKKFIDFSIGEYSYNDYLKIKDYLNDSAIDEDVKEHLFEQWKDLNSDNISTDELLLPVFQKVQYSILLKEKKSVKKRILWGKYSQVAAILLVPVLAFSLWYYLSSKNHWLWSSNKSVTEGWVEINAPEGSRIKFILPDSTSGWLNSGSKLKYPAVFDQHRIVTLAGEGYFNVKHKENSDFVVSVADLEVKALGTKFDVLAYPDDCTTHVVLQEGSVEVKGKEKAFTEILTPDEQMTFNRTEKTLKIFEVDADRFTAWKDSYLIIDDEPFGKAVDRIERWYNVEIVIKDDVLNNFRFKATFKDEPLDEVLRLIAITTPMQYDIEKREVDKNGTWKQRKVTIKLKR